MRRTRIAAAVLVVRVVLALALLPLVAYAAAGSSSYEGTYEGTAEGVGTDGGGGSTAVTVWIEDLGDTARFTLQASEFGITVSTEGPVTANGDAVTVPISVDSMGVRGDATMMLVKGGETWVLTGVGQGEAVGYEGSGSLQAQRVSSGFQLPPIVEQFTNMVSDVFGGPTRAKEQAARKPAGTTAVIGEAAETPPTPTTPEAAETPAEAAETPVMAEEIDEPTPLSPAAPEPPLADNNKLVAAALAALVLILEIILA